MAHEITKSNYNIDKTPDTCPSCEMGISPIKCFEFASKDLRDFDTFLQVVYRCPREKCSSLFIASYTSSRFNRYSDSLYLNRTYLLNLIKFKKFPKVISEISSQFNAIYNQSLVAEENGLKLVAGPGYRKALEFLVKDYLIMIFPSDAEKINFPRPYGRGFSLLQTKFVLNLFYPVLQCTS